MMVAMKHFYASLCLILFGTTSVLSAESPLERCVRTQHLVNALPSSHDYYDKMVAAVGEEKWNTALQYSQALLDAYPSCPFAPEATYYTGFAYMKRGNLAQANEWYSKYLADYGALKHYEDAIKHKFDIAMSFSEGARKNLFDNYHLPKWGSASEDAVQIFDEVIAAFPRDDLAAQSLYRKAELLIGRHHFDDAIEAYKTFIRRFPKHTRTSESYLGIVDAYTLKAKKLYPDPDFIELATISAEKFQRAFPNDERVQVAWDKIAELKEWFAQDLLAHAKYWERKKKPAAADIYYKSILVRYGGTPTADTAKERLTAHEVERKSHTPQSRLPRRH